MPFRAKRVVGSDIVGMQIRLPGWLKNLLVSRADAAGLSLQAYCANALFLAAERDWLPFPPPLAPVPTAMDGLRAYLSGEKLLEPCGRFSPCERQGVPEVTVDTVSYCGVCQIRLG
jgi:hypothetical protein